MSAFNQNDCFLLHPHLSPKGTPPIRKIDFFWALPKLPLPPSPIFGQVVQFFWTSKRRLARITEPSNNDYDNDVSDNCDHNFGTFDDFGVRNDQKVSYNMILMSKYKGQHGGKKGQKIRARPSPPLFRAMPERNRFFLCEVFPKKDLEMPGNIKRIKSVLIERLTIKIISLVKN